MLHGTSLQFKYDSISFLAFTFFSHRPSLHFLLTAAPIHISLLAPYSPSRDLQVIYRIHYDPSLVESCDSQSRTMSTACRSDTVELALRFSKSRGHCILDVSFGGSLYRKYATTCGKVVQMGSLSDGHDMDVSILRARSDPNMEVDLFTRLYRVRIHAIG